MAFKQVDRAYPVTLHVENYNSNVQEHGSAGRRNLKATRAKTMAGTRISRLLENTAARGLEMSVAAHIASTDLPCRREVR